MDNANGRYTIRYKKRKEYCEGLTTYDPFKKKRKNNIKKIIKKIIIIIKINKNKWIVPCFI